MISSAFFAFFTIINCPFASISVDRWFSDDAMKKSSRVCPSYFSWSLTNTPMILEEFCASKIPAILGIYCRSSSSAMTRFTVSSEIFFVFPWITLDTVAVLKPSSCAISLILTRCSSISIPSPVVPLFYYIYKDSSKVNRITHSNHTKIAPSFEGAVSQCIFGSLCRRALVRPSGLISPTASRERLVSAGPISS